MRVRRSRSIWRSVLVLMASLVAVVPALEDPIGAAPADDRACPGRRDAATLADAGDVGSIDVSGGRGNWWPPEPGSFEALIDGFNDLRPNHSVLASLHVGDEPHTEGQRRVRALDPELVWLAHEHGMWRPRTV